MQPPKPVAALLTAFALLQVAGVRVFLEMRAELAADTRWANAVSRLRSRHTQHAHFAPIKHDWQRCCATLTYGLLMQGHIVAEQQLQLPASLLDELEVKQQQGQHQHRAGRGSGSHVSQ
jgi:hypothetical protein